MIFCKDLLSFMYQRREARLLRVSSYEVSP